MKQIEKEMEKLEEEQEAKRVKIKRSDKEALAKVREHQAGRAPLVVGL